MYICMAMINPALGLVYKKGKFSAIEEALLEAAIARYKESRGLEEEDVIDIIFQKEKGRDSFWTEISTSKEIIISPPFPMTY